MAQLDFPLNPTVGQVYAAGEGAWSWDGIKWESAYSAQLYLPLTGGALASPGNLSVGGYLNVTGNSALTGTLHVTGATTLGILTAGSTTLGASTLSSLNVTGTGYTITAPNGAISAGGAINAGSTINAGGDISTPGNVLGANSVQSSGVYFQNNGGNFYSPQSIYSGSEVRAAGAIWTGGMYWQNNSGWMYTPWSLQTNGNLQVNGSITSNNDITLSHYLNMFGLGTFYNPGDNWAYWNSNMRANDFQSNNNVNANGSIIFNGMWLQNNGGYFYNANAWRSNNVVQSYGGQCSLQNLGLIYNNYCGNQWSFLLSGGATFVYIDNGQQGWITYNGCDARQKKNFGPVERDCLEAINAIELQSFDWPPHIRAKRTVRRGPTLEDFVFEDEPLIVPHWKAGYTAQQVREVIPEAVPDPPTENGFMGVDLQMLVAHLVGAVQQLTRRLEAVEGR